MKVNPRNVEYNTADKLVFVNIYMSEKPDPLPTKSDDIADLRRGYDFEVGSWLYISSTCQLYMSNGDGTWTDQTEV